MIPWLARTQWYLSLLLPCLALGLAYSRHLTEIYVKLSCLECFLRGRLIIRSNNRPINYLVPAPDQVFYYVSYLLSSSKATPQRLVALVPVLDRVHGSERWGIFSRSHSPRAASLWLEPRSASLQSLNSCKSHLLLGHSGFTERSLGTGLLIFGMAE